ncbi:MAG TPA: energy transducer TonB [Allosphingosinicella sp.]|jgi:TonB family protein
MTRLFLPSLVALACAAASVPAAAQLPGQPQNNRNLATLFSDGDYPAEAIRKGEQGIVSFELAVGVDGQVTGCTIANSSGSPLLDSTTCSILVRRARFKPATGASGKPLPDTFTGKIVWRLPETGPPPAEMPPPLPMQNATAAAAAFKQLSALVGTWRNADQPNSPLRIRFFLTAGGTTLVESWERAGTPHSLTLYHRDGAALVATHYCPRGNQPRLALSAAAGPNLHFTFRDATDLDPGESHLHDLSFNLTNPARPIRGETYLQGARAEETTLTLVRVGAAS